MFINPPGPEFTIGESLHAGSRHTAIRVDAGITYVTTVELLSLEPAPPKYQVRHAAYREPARKQITYLVVESPQFDDLDGALRWAMSAHHTDVS